MKWLFLAGVVVMLAVASPVSAQDSGISDCRCPEVGRYQVVTGADETVILDTAEGHLWFYNRYSGIRPEDPAGVMLRYEGRVIPAKEPGTVIVHFRFH
jgi:hypothetical protein